MGNDCFTNNQPHRCHVCRNPINQEGVCNRCRTNKNNEPPPPQWNINKMMTATPEKGPILTPSRITNANPFGDGLYPPGAAFQNQNQYINEKIPASSTLTVFKWQRKKTWFYPPNILGFAPGIMRYRTFQEKLLWFRLNIEKMRISWQQGSDQLKIDRGNLLKSSVNAINNKKINLRKQIKINFTDEEVMDAGGLQREWMHLLLKQIFSEEHDTFVMCDTQETAYKFKNDKGNNVPKMKQICRLLGSLLAKAIFDRIPIKCFLNRTILRQICHQPVYINDFFNYDEKLYQSYRSILDNPNAQDLGLDFCIYKTNEDDSLDMIELNPKGQETMLNDSNKTQYVKLCVDYYSTKSCEQYLKELKEGIYRVIPMELLAVFEPHQMEMIINGPPNIDSKDWEQNTIYKGYSPSSQVVKWYWRCVHKMEQDQLCNLLHYTTGTTRVPVLGFKYLESNRNQISRFAIHKADYDKHNNPYPKSHTCFNRLQLPNYPSYQQLEERLLTVVNQELNHFGLD